MSNALIRERIRQNLKPAELASKAHINRTYYWRIENGKKRASLEFAEKISQALNGKVSALQILKIGPTPLPRGPRRQEEAAA